MNSSRRNILKPCLAVGGAAAFSGVFTTANTTTANELIGNWFVENAAENHELQGVTWLVVNADGGALTIVGLRQDLEAAGLKDRWGT